MIRKPDDSRERALGGLVAGVDEAGRAPLAGPVVAAAVILRPGCRLNGVADSKTLPRPRRERLFSEIMASAWVGVAQASVEEIDDLNILGATMTAMQRAVALLPVAPEAVIVDGNRAPALGCRTEALIDGDALSTSVAAASIIAKVTRDRLMCDLAAAHPGYGWERNAGYGTPEHRRALFRLGPTPHHRCSFAPVKKVLETSLSP